MIPVVPAASTSAVEMEYLLGALLFVSFLVLGLVYGLILFFGWRYREANTIHRGKIKERTWRIETGWTVATLIAFLALDVWGADLYLRENLVPPDALKVLAVGVVTPKSSVSNAGPAGVGVSVTLSKVAVQSWPAVLLLPVAVSPICVRLLAMVTVGAGCCVVVVVVAVVVVMTGAGGETVPLPSSLPWCRSAAATGVATASRVSWAVVRCRVTWCSATRSICRGR